MTILSKAARDEFDTPLERLLASVANLRQQPTSKGAHFYRTSLRRFQAWQEVFQPHLDAEQQQAFKFLDKLRKASGKLRDSEVHLELIESFSRVGRADKMKLAKELKARRKSSSKKLKLLLRDSMLSSIWGALRVLDQSPGQADGSSVSIAGATELALEEYRGFVQRLGPLSPESLHEYRLQCKRFRYTAELAGESPKRELLIATWKKAQDVIGEWHDYLTLSEVAKTLVGNTLLNTELLKRTRRKYQASLRAVARCEKRLLVSAGGIPKKEPKRTRLAPSSSQVA